MKVGVVTPLLISVNAVLGAVLIALLVAGTQVSQIRNGQPRPIAVRSVSVEVPPATAVESLQAQAVFHKSRAFYVAPPAPETLDPAPDYRLAGAMSFPNQPMTAMLVHNQTGMRQKVRVGESLDGWTVTDVTARRVVLSLGQRTSEIGTAPGASVGMTHVSREELPQGGNAAGGVKVLSGNGSSTTTAPNNPNNNAPRLYRPPAT